MDWNDNQIKEFRKRILRWYSQKARDLPWRKTKDPYKIWISEIILQQTRITQGISYYHQFLKKFPSIKHLALADELQVLKTWEGLGYYTRARNLLKTARIIYQHYNGKFPQTYDELIKLPGIGHYTASAIGSICFNLPLPAIDGNLRRVLSRLFLIHEPINSNPFNQKTQSIAEQIISRKSPGNFNQALMDIGSQICTPTNPNCKKCPLKNYCLAYKNGNPSQLPVKAKTSSIPILHWTVGIILWKNKILLTREQSKNFLKNLYALPTIETVPSQIKQLEKTIFKTTSPKKLNWKYLFQYTREYSHRTIYFYVYQTQISDKKSPPISESYFWVPLENIHNYPFSKAYLDILKYTTYM